MGAVVLERMRAVMVMVPVVLLVLLGSLVGSGLCQNAEPGRRFHDFRNSPAAKEFESQRDDFWDVPPEGAERRKAKEAAVVAPPPPRGSGNENAPDSYEKSALLPDLQRAFNASPRPEPHDPTLTASHSSSRRLRADRRRRRNNSRRAWKERLELEAAARKNLVNVGGRYRGKENNAGAALAREMRNRRREERRRLRRNRKRIRLESRREKAKWRDNPIGRLLLILNEQKANEARFLSENPLNLSSTRHGDESGTTKAFNIFDSILPSSSQPSQLTTESRIPEPPEPTSRYRLVPGDVEREFSRHVEREYERAQLGERSDALIPAEDEDDDEEADEDEDMDEVIPRFDERDTTVTKEPEASKTKFDAERILGYSRTDEDLPILDMENEVLQRTLKDYNAYMSASAARAKNLENSQQPPSPSPSSTTAPPSDSASPFLADDDEDDPRGDLSCINGTFLPAPFVRHAVIKYVKSSRPGHEYLEADYECEPGYALASSNRTHGDRLMCRARRWIGRLPVCRYRGDDQATCEQLNCEHFCRLFKGRAQCLCREGYRLEGRKCVDIDECLANGGRGPCQDTCRNLPGGYACSCESRPGTSLGPDNRTCHEPSSSGPCSYNNAGCSHTCLASMGRVFCLCPDGFMLEDDWKTCQDVDECAVPDLQTEVCRYGCINTPGSYRCAPPPPPQRPPLDTRRPGGAECPPGYEVTDSRNCVDVNECATNNGGCSEVCENTEGSYFCACEGDERILAADKRTCLVAEKRFESIDREAALRLRFHEASDISCSPLNPAGRGYLICADGEPTTTTTVATPSSDDDSNEENDDDLDDEDEVVDDNEEKERTPIRPGTKCRLKCPRGYELRGEYELTCRADGTWDGPKHGECLRYSKPRLDCPKDVVAELPPGRDEAFVTYEQPSTDLDWFRYVRSKPSWGTRLEANLKQGLHEITFYARHPVSKKQASCSLKINVEEGQAPKVKGCPSDIEVTGKNGSAITWVEPVFTDNVKVTRITSNENPGRTFSTGGHKVEYEAADEAGWTTKCIFTVVLRPEPQPQQ